MKVQFVNGSVHISKLVIGCVIAETKDSDPSNSKLYEYGHLKSFDVTHDGVLLVIQTHNTIRHYIPSEKCAWLGEF